MLSGLNMGLFANLVDQMRFDGIIPEVDAPTAINNREMRSDPLLSSGSQAAPALNIPTGRTMPIMDSGESTLLREIRIDATRDSGRDSAFLPSIILGDQVNHPSILSTPLSGWSSDDIILETEDDYSNIFWKKGSGKKNLPPFSKFKDYSQTATPMPDPGDFEPDDEEGFDPAKKDNHDKVRRDQRFGKLYRDAKDNKTWYSKERSGDRAHGGEHWKRFRQEGTTLFHDADIDMTGKIMNKHKSPTGIKIQLKNTIGIK